ncbi:hypothetical protein J4418_02715 [Candidatus Woesearchaeota archaeon]|nr:hypothetical protein [Candidatus Woesearchaeota archaeon]
MTLDEQLGATGNKCGDWKECAERPAGHGVGYYWMRGDGLRFGLRKAGKYYKLGEVADVKLIEYEIKRFYFRGNSIGIGNDAGSLGSGGLMNVPSIDATYEVQKREYLPEHIRYMFNNKEIELLISLEGETIERINRRNEEHKFFEYADKKWPKGVFGDFAGLKGRLFTKG